MLNFLKKILVDSHKTKLPVISASQYSIDIESISSNAIKVIHKLNEAGYQAYLVGGSVRDLLLQKKPKDFDVVTNAKPEEVRDVFPRNCQLIGRRFRLAHIYFRGEFIEVATLRTRDENSVAQQQHNGLIIRDNIYGNSLSEDAKRRDFTINALFYDIINENIIDPTGGLKDLEQQTIRMIGDPAQRFQEDPIRILRAIRFASKLNFTIDKETTPFLSHFGKDLPTVPNARLFEEFFKLLFSEQVSQAFAQLKHYNLLSFLLPQTANCLKGNSQFNNFVNIALHNTDIRIRMGKSISPAFLIAVFLWQPMQEQFNRFKQENSNISEALIAAYNHTLQQHNHHILISKRIAASVKDIWFMQELLKRTYGKKPFRLIKRKLFRAAYDFLLLRADADEPVKDLALWWTEFQDDHAETINSLHFNMRN